MNRKRKTQCLLSWLVPGMLKGLAVSWLLVVGETLCQAQNIASGGVSDENLRDALKFLSSSQTNLQELTTRASVRALSYTTKGDVNYPNLSGDCTECHRRLQPNLVYQWEISRHAGASVGCDGCHGRNHSQIFRENGTVSAGVCSKCHPTQGKAFANSRHAAAVETLTQSALFAVTPEAAREACSGCHRIGATHLDGSRGSCNFCHPGHTFSAADARGPEACTGCHTGEDYPQDIAYWTSKHGALYMRTRDAKVAPTCATCHHPDGFHGDDFGITIGGSGSGGTLSGKKPPIPMREISAQTFSEKRKAMNTICAGCHSSRFAEDSLRRADGVKTEGNAFLAQAAEIIEGLHEEGKIGDGTVFDLQLGGEQLPVDANVPGSELLNRFYEMWRFHYAWAWKGAYHFSHRVSNLQSRPGLNNSQEVVFTLQI